MGKILSIDFGLKRTGLAISDSEQNFAFGIDTVPSDQLMEELIRLNQSEGLDIIVLGLPSRLDTSDSHITENVRLLKSALEKEFPNIEVVLYDERFTSKMASQAMHMSGATKKQKKQKGLVDKVSATILLQSFISSKQP